MRALLKWATPALVLVNVALVISGLLDPRDAVFVVVAVELLLVLSVIGSVLAGLRAFHRDRRSGATPWSAFVATVDDVLPAPMAAALLHEATIVRSLWLAIRRRDDGVGPADDAFSYAAGAGLTMGALTVVAAVELIVVHLLVPWPWARTLLILVGLWSVVLVLGAWAGLCRHPHVVSADRLLLRAGPRVAVEVPWRLLSGVRRHSLHDPTSVKAVGRRLHLPIHGSTRLIADLTEPVTAHLSFGRTAEVDSIAFSADDPAALHAAVLAALARNSPTVVNR